MFHEEKVYRQSASTLDQISFVWDACAINFQLARNQDSNKTFVELISSWVDGSPVVYRKARLTEARKYAWLICKRTPQAGESSVSMLRDLWEGLSNPPTDSFGAAVPIYRRTLGFNKSWRPFVGQPRRSSLKQIRFHFESFALLVFGMRPSEIFEKAKYGDPASAEDDESLAMTISTLEQSFSGGGPIGIERRLRLKAALLMMTDLGAKRLLKIQGSDIVSSKGSWGVIDPESGFLKLSSETVEAIRGYRAYIGVFPTFPASRESMSIFRTLGRGKRALSKQALMKELRLAKFRQNLFSSEGYKG